MNVLNQNIDQRYALYQGDCVEVMKGIPANSIHYAIFSPPFASLYTYSSSDRDMGNSRDNGEFQIHFGYLIEELYRTLMPGRVLSIHCMNLPAMKSRDGFIGIKDFRGDIIRQFVDAGFIFHSEVCIWKNPVTEMQRTKALGLLHKQIRKDSAMCRQGLPDYLVTFRKPGENPEPIPHDMDSFPVNVWQRYASPVWMDIRQSNTLQRKSARDEKDEKHICPLQLDVIERGIDLWTNPNDIVLDPFAGIGSVPWQAVQMGRRAVGIELKDSYFTLMEQNMVSIEKEYRENGADPTVLLRCTKCGIKIQGGESVCPICGTEVNS
jgi:DNA modification methylase